MLLTVFGSLSVVPVYLTGEHAEETVENLPGVSEAFIEEHEEAGQFTLWIVLTFGAVSIIGLIISRNQQAKWFNLVMLLCGVLAFASATRTAYIGGKIRHSEIRGGAPADQGNDTEGEAADEDD
jgi:hypothetical protein